MVGVVSVNDHAPAFAHRYDHIAYAASDQVRADQLGGPNVGPGLLGYVGGFVQIRDQEIGRKIVDGKIARFLTRLLQWLCGIEDDFYAVQLCASKSAYDCFLWQSPVYQTDVGF